MSCDEGPFLTETERAAGCSYRGLDIEWKAELEAERNAEVADRKERIINSALLKEAAKIIAGTENKKQIKNKLIHKLMLIGTDYAISNYFFKESIPPNYSEIVKSHDCIEVLIKGIFYKICKIKHSDSLDLQIMELCEALRRNDAYLIAYDRVGLVQKFIHRKVNEFCGEGSHEKIPTKHMRNLLSVSRLHLNISDLNTKDEGYSIYMDEISRSASNFEYVNPRATELPADKHFIPKWRVRHIKPLSHFCSGEKRRIISKIYALNEQLPLEEYTQVALEIYAFSE